MQTLLQDESTHQTTHNNNFYSFILYQTSTFFIIPVSTVPTCTLDALLQYKSQTKHGKKFRIKK